MNNSSNAKTKNTKLPSIQSFRGIAALLVVAFHLTVRSNELLKQNLLAGLFSFGSAGVDFFFVLSGFVIFYVHRYDTGNSRKLKNFLLKRFVRIYPIYFLLTLLIIPVYLAGYGHSYKSNIDIILKSFLLYPQSNGIYPILNVGWTLSYEVLFYLFSSLAILLKPQLTRIIFALWILTIITVYIARISSLFVPDNTLINFIFNIRNLEFILGSLAAYLVQKQQFRHSSCMLMLGILSFLLFGMNDAIFNFVRVEPVIAYGIPSALIIIGAASRDLINSPKVPRIFLYFGDASYSIYLTHFVAMTALMSLALKLHLISFMGYPLTVAIITVMTLILGCLVFQYIENPLLAFLRKKIWLYGKNNSTA